MFPAGLGKHWTVIFRLKEGDVTTFQDDLSDQAVAVVRDSPSTSSQLEGNFFAAETELPGRRSVQGVPICSGIDQGIHSSSCSRVLIEQEDREKVE